MNHANHTCLKCHKTFRRSDHLKRHFDIHEANNEHLCNRCGRRYSRSDARKRHEAKCTGGRRDVNLTGNSSAASCITLPASTQCRFRLAANRALQSTAPSRHANQTVHTGVSRASHGVTDPAIIPQQKDDDFPEKINTRLTPPSSPLVDLVLHDKLLHTCLAAQDPAQSFQFLRLFTSGAALTEIFSVDLYEDSIRAKPCNAKSRCWAPQKENDHTSWRDYTAISHQCAIIQLAVEALQPKYTGESIDHCQGAQDFFSKHAVAENLDSYWKNWHPHWPNIHWPTFNPCSVSPFLLAAMAVLGGRYSSSNIYREQARSLYNVVEILVFTALETAIDSFDSTAPASQHVSSLLETLQAAYIVTVYQNWDGSVMSRRRIRRQRFSQVVEGTQLLCHTNPMHEDLRDASTTQFNWRLFVLEEQIIR